jgi:hypothetical protein
LAVITTYGLQEVKSHIAAGVDYADSLSSFSSINHSLPALPYDVSTTTYSALQDNQPISEPEQVFTSYPSTSFLDDYYYRVHVSPGQLALGNLLSSQVRYVEVWSAYFAPQLLASVGEVGTDGIDLLAPEAPPTYFAELEARTYTLSISTNGSPVIDALYTFNFPDDTPTLGVTGRRVVVWPFVPQVRHKEALEWKTDILPSYENEQRLALRVAPRQAFSYEFQLTPRQFSKAKAIATQWAHRVYGIPVWAEVTHVGPLTMGATEILFNTSFADYRANDILIVWESAENYLAVENLAVLADRVTLKLPLERSFTNAYVAPMRFSRTLQGMNFTRDSNEVIVAKGTFDVSANTDLGAAVGYPQHRGKDVLNDRTIKVGDMTERISRAITIIDNGSGPISVDIENNWVNSAKYITFDTTTREQRWKARKWIHARRGRQKAFWLPSWNPDLILLEDVGSTAAALTVLPIAYPLYYDITNIMVQLKSGVQVFARVTSGATNEQGNEVLVLDGQIGTAFTVAQVEFICFMSHVRFNSDRIDISHDAAGRASMSIPCLETPE